MTLIRHYLPVKHFLKQLEMFIKLIHLDQDHILSKIENKKVFHFYPNTKHMILQIFLDLVHMILKIILNQMELLNLILF